MRHDPRKCNALHCAAENFRDAGILEVSLSVLDQEAEEYVREGLAACTCPDGLTPEGYTPPLPEQREPGAES